jgi:prepilin-type processing-associated H-X9-DG protein
LMQQMLVSGCTRDVFYDPGFPDQNRDDCWNYFGVHVTGYAYSWENTPSLTPTNQNRLIVPTSITDPTRPGSPTYPPPNSGARPLTACATLCTDTNNPSITRASAYQFTQVAGGLAPAFYHNTAHLNGKMPAGGNIGMLDGHVEWRFFQNMSPRTVYSDNGGQTIPVFWW